MSKEKLNLEDLKKVAGGTLEEGYAYMDSLIVKYGLAPGDYATLDGMMTDEELDYFADLVLKK